MIAANPTVTAAPTSIFLPKTLTQRHSCHLESILILTRSLETLLILDTLQTLADTVPEHLPTFLSSLLGPSISVLAIFHIDVPLTIQKSSLSHHVYAPDPLTTLCYLATAILRVSNLSHVIARKKARDRSLQEPDFGVSEGREGVLAGIGGHEDGVVVDMEVRRKSGRGVKEVFVFGALAAQRSPSEAIVKGGIGSKICLLDDHPLYARPADVVSGVVVGAATGEGDEPETTFSLGLTEKQRRDREGVVLPYFDAQTGEGPGEGGRILYEMGREDDYDEDEDDEI